MEKNDKPKFRAEVHKTQILLDQTDIILISDHLDMCQHIYRDWNCDADYLTHKAREEGPAWNAFQTKERIEAIGVYFDGGVSHEEDKKVKNRVCPGWLIQVTETIGKQIGLQWKTVVEVARVLVDEATIIEVELMAATEAVKAVMCLTRTQGRSNLISMVILLTNGKEGKRKTRGRRILMMKMKMILQGVMKEDG